MIGQGQTNKIWIPDTLAGPVFDLSIKDTFAQIRPGQQTITAGINSKYLGPTLIFQSGDTVKFNVKNNMNEPTTLHWHGIHLPAVMDGGPHQMIPVGAIWKPYWKVENKAASYWYHPHLHEKTAMHTLKGAAGLIIIRDPEESRLDIPRRYGIDDFPLIIQSQQFSADNQIITNAYQDSIVLVNGTEYPFLNVPAQKIRLRLLNASNARNFNLGVSADIPMYLIATDGGLLGRPLLLPRIRLSPGERAEVILDLQGKQGDSIFLKSYGSEIPAGTQGGPILALPLGTPPMKSPLNGADFNVLNFKIGSPTTVVAGNLPDSLAIQTKLTEDMATETRQIKFSPKILGAFAGIFYVNDSIFKLDRIDLKIPLNNIEIWNISNQTPVAHPFHLHGFEFYILDRYGAPPSPEEAGLKDVVLVYPNEQLRIIAKFSNYADSLIPYMFHCHLLIHEDDGMMAQFVVKDINTENVKTAHKNQDFTISPNPVDTKLRFIFSEPSGSAYYIKIINSLGKVIYMLPEPGLENGLDVKDLKTGMYELQYIDKLSKRASTKRFLKL